MSQDKNIEFVDSVQNVVISEYNPCTGLSPINGDASDLLDSSTYYDLTSTDVQDSGSNTVVTFTGHAGSWADDAFIGRLLLALSGNNVGRCFTINDNTSDTITVYENYEGIVAVGTKFTIVHTAKSMFDYCVTNNKKCVAVACESVEWGYSSPEKPKKYAAHMTKRIGTGKFDQSVKLSNCSIWYDDPRFRLYILNKFNEYLYSWLKDNSTKAVYLIVTASYLMDDGTVLYSNHNFFHNKAGSTGLNAIKGRGYLKGFPMGNDGKTDFVSESTIPFEEAWS